MIKVYYRKNCNSSRKVLEWFQEHSISIRKTPLNQIHSEDLVKILQLTDTGMPEITKSVSACRSLSKKKLVNLEKMKLKEGIDYLVANTELLRSPIILDLNKMMVGYNEENIRQFISNRKSY